MPNQPHSYHSYHLPFRCAAQVGYKLYGATQVPGDPCRHSAENVRLASSAAGNPATPPAVDPDILFVDG